MSKHQSLSFFDYTLPPEAIAQQAAAVRHDAKLLCAVDVDGVDHRHVRDLCDYLQAGDVLVVNDTKVMAARLKLQKETGGEVEVFLLEPTGDYLQWFALVKPSKRVKPQTLLYLDDEPVAEAGAVLGDGRRIVKLLREDVISRAGRVPLPPYIKDDGAVDPKRYQTVFADREASVAAPTAGLHLSEALLEKIEAMGVTLVKVELQVGLGTFKPIVVDDIADHQMHTESYTVSDVAWKQINDAKQAGGRVVAVGTTVVRTLESAAKTGKLTGRTDLFISRGFEFQLVDLLMTNFHVPKSSLLVMIDAFIGPRWKELYEIALTNEYRFLSLGDAMLLVKKAS